MTELGVSVVGGCCGTTPEHLAEVVTQVRRDQGTAVVLVEHDLHLVEEVVDRLAVLDFGRMIAVGSVGEVMADPQVRRAYLGSGA